MLSTFRCHIDFLDVVGDFLSFLRQNFVRFSRAFVERNPARELGQWNRHCAEFSAALACSLELPNGNYTEGEGRSFEAHCTWTTRRRAREQSVSRTNCRLLACEAKFRALERTVRRLADVPDRNRTVNRRPLAHDNRSPRPDDRP